MSLVSHVTHHVYPENTNRAHREHTSISFVQETKSNNQKNDLSNVSSQKVHNESLDIREQATTFANRDDNGIEVTMFIENGEQILNMNKTHSSVNTRSEASLATSEPAIPIAIPTGASFKAGESLTPSPDIDRCFPLRFPA